jgi:DNA-binding transcriptional LysR family regulator
MLFIFNIMLDFRLRVFYTVAKLLNFTKAAATLHVTQPAVTKHIKELEQYYKVTLFDRQPNALTLTEAGNILLRHAATVMEQYDLLEFDMNAFHNKLAGDLHIGASTTIAQYILPPVLASFHQRYPDVRIHLANENSNRILQSLLQKNIDIGLVEGKANNSNVHFIPYLHDDIVLVCSDKNKKITKQRISIKEVATLPLVMREGESGTYEIIEEKLKSVGIEMGKLNIELRLASTESIKLFLEHSDHFAFISIHAIAKEIARGALRVIEIENVEIGRTLHIALRQGQPLPIVEPFLRFLNKRATPNIKERS